MPVFEEIVRVVETEGELKKFRGFSGTLLMPMDGTEYFSSQKIQCPNCSTRTLKSGKTCYFHGVVTPVIACPGRTQVIPLMPEFIVPQDGHEKQDCETAAAKPWIVKHGKRYAPH
ncbi:MAG: hypothetical protein F6J98_42480 [Moorea sp. SIO4G2]|nr:hypothetical protein [Moorena sp. SIO4G2]